MSDDADAPEQPELDDERPGLRFYTVAGANALVAHLNRVFDQVDAGRARVQELVNELVPLGVKLGRVLPPVLAHDPRVRPQLEELLAVNEELQAVLGELAELGVEVKTLDGLVDVRSRFEGRVVCLCWRRGEPAFEHWHEVEAGFAGRAPILTPEAFEGTLLN